ncbi:MAG: phage minor tail protein L [Bacteroidetes bacterium]|nr:phage minor tail protein L [Bacteroidota bacterium]
MSRESNQKLNAELFSLEPTALLEFFVICYDYVNRPDDKLYIHGGTNGINGSIYWQGVEYLPFPIQSSGFESKGDGSLPRPKLTVSNQDFFVSNLIRRYNNLVGAKVIRKRTFAKFLDNQNYSDSKNPYGSADAAAGLEDQVFYILRRASENRAIVEFELASPLEIEDVTFPRRSVIARYCGFHYRGNGCKYMGPPVADENDMRLRKAIDIKAGLLRRYYTGAGATAPTNTSTFTSIVAAATTFNSESVQTTTTIADGNNAVTEFIGYFKVNNNEAGVYGFGVDPDDCAELWINGSLIASDYASGPQNASLATPVLAPQGTTGEIFLSAGYHRIFVRHYEATDAQGLILYYKKPPITATLPWVQIPTSRFYYDALEQNTLTSNQRFFSNLQLSSSISLNNDALSDGLNRGLWKANAGVYKVGEFVYIENYNIKVAKRDINAIPNWTPLLRFYVCVKTHTASGVRNPSFNKEYWVSDQCSKTLNGCKLRFGAGGDLPFGGFPGVEEYSVSSQ